MKDIFVRLRGTPITASKMKAIKNHDGNVKIFAGGKTVVEAFERDIPHANIIRRPAVLVQSRGVIDTIYCDEPFTFKNEMWAYTHDDDITLKYLYYVLKNNMSTFRDAASGMGSLPQISLAVTEDFVFCIPNIETQQKIVTILDHFESLTRDLKSGLPAEIEKHQKRYEYYRDKLLAFPEKK